MTTVEQILHFSQECFKMKRLFSAMFHVGAGLSKTILRSQSMRILFPTLAATKSRFQTSWPPPEPHHTPQTTPAHGKIPYRYHITKVRAARVYLCVCLAEITLSITTSAAMPVLRAPVMGPPTVQKHFKLLPHPPLMSSGYSRTVGRG